MTELVVDSGSQADRGVVGGVHRGRAGAVSTSFVTLNRPTWDSWRRGAWAKSGNQSITCALSVFGNRWGIRWFPITIKWQQAMQCYSAQCGQKSEVVQVQSSARKWAGGSVHDEHSQACMFCTAAVNADPEVNGGSWQYLPTATRDFRVSIEGIRQACCCVLNAAASYKPMSWQSRVKLVMSRKALALLSWSYFINMHNDQIYSTCIQVHCPNMLIMPW